METVTTVKAYRATAEISVMLWILFIICFLGNVTAGSVSTLMSVYLPVIVPDLLFSMEGEQLNRVSSYINAIYLAGWTIGGFLWGWIADRIGRSKSLAISVSMFGLFTFLMAFVPSWELLIVFRFLSGFGVGGTLVLNSTLVTEVWPERTRAIFIGFLSMGFPMGIISSGTINYMVTGWRTGFIFGLFPLIIGILSLWLLKESEKWKNLRLHTKISDTRVIFREHGRNLINGSIIFGSMLIGLWAVFSWLPTWIQSLMDGNDGSRERGLSMMLLGTGGLAGGFASGWISNALGTRKAMLLSFAGSFILALLLFKGNSEFTGIVLVEIALLAFMFGISQGLLSFYIPQLFPIAIRATATGFCFNTGRIFTTAAVFFIGWLVLLLGGYSNSLFTFSFIFLVGFIILYFSKNIAN